MRSALLFAVCFGLLSLESRAATGLRVPPDFEIAEFAGSDLANDITCLTVDAQGRIIVSGKGYIRRLIDANRDGKADRAETIATLRDAAHGLLVENDTLWYMADGGLHRMKIGEPSARLVYKFKTGGEHDAHAIRRGPDGWLYVLCGNNTGIDAKFVDSTRSPIVSPVAGVVVRFSPDFSQREIVADGFRNPYDFDFSPQGALFTFDSDNERCVSLPWYEHTRCYHVVPGGHYGWQNPQHAAFWRQPPYFVDVIAPVCTLGRGSPTGVVWQAQWPEKFQGLYLLDWTFGRIWHVQPKSVGSTYRAEPTSFLETTGTNGFAPTSIDVHPSGDLYVSIGGRGTRGAVYRIRYRGDAPKTPTQSTTSVGSLEWKPTRKTEILRDAREEADYGIVSRAIRDAVRFRDKFAPAEIESIVRRHWDRDDRVVSQWLAKLVSSLPAETQDALAKDARSARQINVVGFGIVASRPERAIDLALVIVSDKNPALKGERLAAVRLIQLALGDLSEPSRKGHVWEGYSFRKPAAHNKTARLRSTLLAVFPSDSVDLDREVSRILAALEVDDAGFRRLVAARLGESSDPVEDVHYLIVLSRLTGARTDDETKAVASALLALDAKLSKRKMQWDRNWPLRIAELHEQLARKDSRLNADLLADAAFGRPDHVVFVRSRGFDRRAAARRFVERSRTDKDFVWTPDVAGMLKELPDAESLPLARQLFAVGGMDEALLPLIARAPQPADAPRFLAAATSPSLPTVRLALAALRKLRLPAEMQTVVPLVRGMQSLPPGKESESLHSDFLTLLREMSGQDPGTSPDAWVNWVTKKWPEAAKQLQAIDGVDIERWKKRLAQIPWSEGSAERGKTLFVRASCSACHSGGQALGPDLAGVGKRFSRDDLFVAILQPNRDVSARYRAILVETTDGRSYQGLMVYEAVDGIILQTGATETVRIDGKKIESKRTLLTSIMPAGLLDRLDDRELADLYAFLANSPPAK